MAFCIHQFEYSRMNFPALVREKHFPHRCVKITVLESVAWPPSGNSDVSGDFQETSYLGHSSVFSDFWINMVNIMRPRVALGFTLNMFQF